jgi:fructokinase
LPVECADELPGPACHCGKHGCIEAWLSGPALVADYQRLSNDRSTTDVLTLIAAAAQGNSNAKAALTLHTQRLARSLATIINVCDPKAIVLGGGVSQRPGLIEALNAELPKHVFLPAGTPLKTRLLLPQFGDSSGVRGAARLI